MGRKNSGSTSAFRKHTNSRCTTTPAGEIEAPVSEDLIVNERIGRINQIGDGNLKVIDYKTGRIPKKVDNFQLLFYMGILSRTLNYPVSKISYLHLYESVWHSFSITENDTQTTRDKVLETAREIELERGFPPTAGPFCQFCDFLKVCDAGWGLVATATDPALIAL